MTTTLSQRETAVAAGVPPHRRIRPLHELLERAAIPCEVVLPSGETLRYGEGPPEFRLRLYRDRPFRSRLDELSIARAYVDGDFEVELDMLRAMDLRLSLTDRIPLGLLLLHWAGYFLRRRTSANRRAIAAHYSLGDDFYLSFIDKRYRFYSHGIFRHEGETIEEASEHKLERMYDALELRPGMRLLDIGAGWGGVAEYCGTRGVHVTGLTIADDSYAFNRQLIERRQLPAEIRLEDFLEHRPARPYDAIVIFGVIEHIPNYRRFVRRVWECLRPGGRLYLDASASREKYAVSAFSRRYIWPGTHTFLCLQNLVRELLYHGMDVLEVRNEARDYELTMRQWAERLDATREAIIARWGARTYRAFRVYLWGGCRAFRQDLMQAYSVVARRTDRLGPRPGWLRRAANGLKELV